MSEQVSYQVGSKSFAVHFANRTGMEETES